MLDQFFKCVFVQGFPKREYGTAALGLSEDLIATLTSDVTTYEDN